MTKIKTIFYLMILVNLPMCAASHNTDQKIRLIRTLNNIKGTTSLAFHPKDNSILASGDPEGTIKLWNIDAKSENLIFRIGKEHKGHYEEISSLAFNPEGTTLASASTDKTIRLFHIKNRKLKNTKIIEPKTNTAPLAIAFHPKKDGILAAGFEDGTIELWDIQDIWNHKSPPEPKLISSIAATNDPGMIYSIAFNPEGSILASGYDNELINLWNVKEAQKPILISSITATNDSPGAILSIAFSPEGSILASGGDNELINLWNVKEAQKPILISSTEEMEGGVFSIAFHPSGNTLASGSQFGTQLWNVKNPKKPTLINSLITGSNTDISSVAFNTQGTILASGNKEGTIKLWGPFPAKTYTLKKLILDKLPSMTTKDQKLKEQTQKLQENTALLFQPH